MPEAQYVVSGFNIAGLDPIEVSKPVTGSSITLADSDIGKMNVFSGSATTTVTLPSASGTLEGYSKAGRMIGLRGAAGMTAVVTINLPDGTYLRMVLAKHLMVLVSDGTNWFIHTHNWPSLVGYFSSYRGSNVALTVNGVSNLIYNTSADALGNADGWYNTTSGVYSPLLRGYYDFNVMCEIACGVTQGVFLLYMGKNGSATYVLDRRTIAASANEILSGTITLYANGSTDSFQPMAFATVAGTHTAGAGILLQATYKGPI